MTEQSVSDKLRDLADTLYDRLEDFQDAMAAGLRDAAMEAEAPASERHKFVPGDLVRIESEPDGLPVGNYMIVFNNEECDNRRVPSLLVKRGDGLGHHARGFNDVWWVKGSDCAFIAHTGINPRDFKREPVVNPERRFRAGDLVRVGPHAPGDLPAGNYMVVHDDGTDWMPFVIYRGDGEGCTCTRFRDAYCTRFRDAYWAGSDELTLIAHTKINPEDFKTKAA